MYREAQGARAVRKPEASAPLQERWEERGVEIFEESKLSSSAGGAGPADDGEPHRPSSKVSLALFTSLQANTQPGWVDSMQVCLLIVLWTGLVPLTPHGYRCVQARRYHPFGQVCPCHVGLLCHHQIIYCCVSATSSQERERKCKLLGCRACAPAWGCSWHA